MELKNQKVKHKLFGIGTVINQENGNITVQFSNKTKNFVYPNAFSEYLKAENSEIQDIILNEIEEAKIIEAERKRAEENIRKAEERRKAEEKSLTKSSAYTSTSIKTSYVSKPDVKSQRIKCKRMTYLVFQGHTYKNEFKGGYIWAPISNSSGQFFHHWDRLLEVMPGDIIFHNYNGYVQAISTAKSNCYECISPKEESLEELWDKEGRRIDCDYIHIDNPIKTITFKHDIIRLCNTKYAPFDKNGNGNMGYLFELNRELAYIFLKASVEQNPYLGSVDYVQELINECEKK